MLNISRSIYAGYNTASTTYELPEAEIIPIGESANEKRKLVKAAKDHPALYEHENVPLPGFTLIKTNRKNWGSTDQTWIIIDPRGFLVRISNNNLEDILHVSGITEGLIQEKCVWARDNTETKMTLVPVSSPSYTEAVQNTELIEGKVSIKDVQIGDTVLLQNKLKGKFCGVLSLYGPINDYSYTGEHRPQVYMRRQVVEVSKGKYYYQTDAKILKVETKTVSPLTKEESASKLNKEIATGNTYFSTTDTFNTSYYSARGMISHASVKAEPKPSLSFVEIDEVTARDLFIESFNTNDQMNVIFVDHADRLFLAEFPYSLAGKTMLDPFEFRELKAGTLQNSEYIAYKDKKVHSAYNSSVKPNMKTVDEFTKFYKIVKHIKTETYVNYKE